MICENLAALRKMHGFSQEQVAEYIGVSRQALAKYENGDTVPDIEKCIQLAELYNVSLDDLANYSEKEAGLPLPPKGKHIFGAVTVGEKGQIVIPKKARKVFDIHAGDSLIVLGDEAQGIAIVKADDMLSMVQQIQDSVRREKLKRQEKKHDKKDVEGEGIANEKNIFG